MNQFIVYTALIMLSLFGTSLTDFALGIWVLDQDDTGISSFTLIWFFQAFPPVILGLLVGSLVDRWDKKRIIVFGQLTAGIASLLLILLHQFSGLLPWHIMIVASISSAANLFIFSSFMVVTKTLIPSNKLPKVQGVVIMSYSVIGIGVPLLSPVLYNLIGIGNIFLIDMITFLIPIICFLLIRFEPMPKSEEPLNIKKDFILVKKFFLKRKGLMYLMAFNFIGGFSLGLIQVLFVPMILDFSSEYTLGLIMAVVSVGGVLGGFIMSRLKETVQFKPIRLKFYVYMLVGFLLMLFVIKLNPYTLAIIGMLVVTLFSIEDVLDNAFSLTIIPVELQGRVLGFMSLFSGISIPLAFLISGFLVDFIKPFFQNNPILLAHLPGTNVTTTIVVLFFASGILLFITSFFFRRKKVIKKLDVLYVSELNKAEQENSESEKSIAKELIVNSVDI